MVGGKPCPLNSQPPRLLHQPSNPGRPSPLRKGGVGNERRNLSGSFKPPLPWKPAAQALAVLYTILQRRSQWAMNSIPGVPALQLPRSPPMGRSLSLESCLPLSDTASELRSCSPSSFNEATRLDFSKKGILQIRRN